MSVHTWLPFLTLPQTSGSLFRSYKPVGFPWLGAVSLVVSYSRGNEEVLFIIFLKLSSSSSSLLWNLITCPETWKGRL